MVEIYNVTLTTTASILAGVATQAMFQDALASVFVAGMAGGFIRYSRTGGGVRMFATSVLTGGILAQFGWPLALGAYTWATGIEVSLDAAQTGQTGGFLMGLFGVAGIGFVFDSFEAKAALAKERNKGGEAGE